MPSPAHSFSQLGGERLLRIELPALDSLSGVDLDIGEQEVRLALPGCRERLRIPLPEGSAGSLGEPSARFSRKRRELTIAWPSASGEQPNAASAASQSQPPWTPPGSDSASEAQCQLAAGAAPSAPPRSAPAEAPGATPAAGASDEGTAADATRQAEEDRPAHSAAVAAAPELGWTMVEESRIRPEPVCCLELLQTEVACALKRCTLQHMQGIAELGGCSVLLDDFDVQGEATADRGACHFKASVTFGWQAMDALGGFLGVGGAGRVQQLTEDDPPPEVTVRASGSGGPRAAAARWMRERGAAIVAESLRGSALADGVREALAERAEEEAAAEPARPPSPRSLGEWARSWLEERLGALSVRLFGGLATATFGSPQVHGDSSDLASASSAGLRMECKWIAESQAGRTEGSLVVSGLRLGAGAEACEVVVDRLPGKKASGQVLTAMRGAGASAVRALLASFLAELKARSTGTARR